MSKKELWFTLILVLTPVLFLIVSHTVLNFNGLYGQDAHRYYQHTLEIQQWFQHGVEPGDFYWPVFYTLSGFVLGKVLAANYLFALQLISVIALSVTGLLMLKAGRRPYSTQRFMLILILVIFCPTLVLRSVVVMSDMMAMLWVMATWFFFLKLEQKAKVSDLLLLVLASAFAITTRYPTLFLVAVPLIISLWKVGLKKPLMVIAAILVFFAGILPEIELSNWRSNVGNNELLDNWSVLNFVQNDFQNLDGHHQYRFPNILYVTYPFWHPAYMFFGIVILIVGIMKRKELRIHRYLILTIALYLLFLAGLPVQSRRFFIPVFPLIVMAILDSGLLQTKVLTLRTWLAAVLILIQIAIAGYYMRPLLDANKFERKLAYDLLPYQGKTLYVFYWDSALRSYELNFEYYNLWQQNYDHYNPGALVLFYEEGLMEQWEDHQLMKNWERLKANHSLFLLEQWENGWQLYEIE